MSHAIKQTTTITNLHTLRKAAEACGPLELEVMPGLQLNEQGQLCRADGTLFAGKATMHYRTYKDDHGGRWVGDWPTPKGMTPEECGDNAAAVIRIKGNNTSYEIGVIPEADGTFSLCHDFWSPGAGELAKYLGKTKHSGPSNIVEAYGDLVQKYNALTVGGNCEQLGVDCQYMERDQLIAYLRSSGMVAEAEAVEHLPKDGSLYAVADAQTQLRISEGG